METRIVQETYKNQLYAIIDRTDVASDNKENDFQEEVCDFAKRKISQDIIAYEKGAITQAELEGRVKKYHEILKRQDITKENYITFFELGKQKVIFDAQNDLQNFLETESVSQTMEAIAYNKKRYSRKKIKFIQEILGFTGADLNGKVWPKTIAAIMVFQKNKQMIVDGKVGPKTLREMSWLKAEPYEIKDGRIVLSNMGEVLYVKKPHVILSPDQIKVLSGSIEQTPPSGPIRFEDIFPWK